MMKKFLRFNRRNYKIGQSDIKSPLNIPDRISELYDFSMNYNWHTRIRHYQNKYSTKIEKKRYENNSTTWNIQLKKCQNIIHMNDVRKREQSKVQIIYHQKVLLRLEL